jgi:hypothetical protein
MDQPRRRGTPPLQPEFECLRPLSPLIEAGPTQADCQNTELHPASQELGGSQGIGSGSAIVMSDALKAQSEQASILYAVYGGLKAARSLTHTHTKINCSVNAGKETFCTVCIFQQ